MQHAVCRAESVLPVCRVILERQGFFDVDNSIEAEAGQTSVEPPVDHLVDLLTEFRILPVEVGLFFVEHMEIVFVLMPRKLLPDRTAKIGSPVAGELPVLHGLDVEELSVLSIRIFACFFEPLMLIGAVIDDQVHQDIHIPLFCLSEKPVHVLHRAETRINAVIIRDIITLVGKRRDIDR